MFKLEEQATELTREHATQTEPLETVKVRNCSITLLGTAHVSKASADKVQELIATGKYDAVAVELCPSRHKVIVNPDAMAKMDLFQVIKNGQASMVAASLALGAFQQRMAEQFNIEPGTDRVPDDGMTGGNIPGTENRERTVNLCFRGFGCPCIITPVPEWSQFTVQDLHIHIRIAITGVPVIRSCQFIYFRGGRIKKIYFSGDTTMHI